MRRLWMGLAWGFLGLILVTKIAEWTGEAQWFAALGYDQTFRRLISWRAGSFLAGSALWAAILWPNARLALFHIARRGEALELLGPSSTRAEPPFQTHSPARVRRNSALVFVLLGAWLGGVATANRFDMWMLFFGASGLGEFDTASNRDLSFFLFVLPALEWAWNSFGLALSATWLGVAALYLSAELIETGPRLLRVAHRAAWHLSTLAALLVVWLGVRHGLDILGAPVTSGWAVNTIFGAPEARLGVGANGLVLASSLVVSVLGLIWAARGMTSRAFGLFSLWALIATITPMLAPSFGRSLRLDDQGAQKIAIERHLDSTRRAWGLSDIQSRTLRVNERAVQSPTPLVDETTSASSTSFEAQRAQFAARFGGASLWPAPSVASILTRRESDSERNVARAHADVVNGKLVFRAISSKRGARDDAPAMAYETDAESPGSLSVTKRVELGSVLMGESESDVGRRFATAEPLAPVAPLPPWRATTQSTRAVPRDRFWPSLALAWRFMDATLLRPGPPITWHLDPVARARALLPFVNWNGAVARPVLAETGEGTRLFWMVDGCFTSRHFPDAATLPTSPLPSLGGWRGVNYARQSVVATIDATTGDANFYLIAPDEPFARVWKRAFPGAFRDIQTLSPTLRRALKISPPLADASAQVWSRYHFAGNPRVDEAASWAQNSDGWRALADDVGRSPWNAWRAPGTSDLIASCAFATSTGRAPVASSTSAPSAGALTAILWANNAWEPNQTRPKWREWRLERTLDLPELVGGAPTMIRSGRIELPHPTIVSFLPRAGDAGAREPSDELLVVRGEIAQTKTQPLESLSSASFALFGNLPVPINGDDAATLVQARTQWSQLRRARSAGQWNEVARLERALNALLKSDSEEKSGPQGKLER